MLTGPRSITREARERVSQVRGSVRRVVDGLVAKEQEMGRNRGYVVLVAGKYLGKKDDDSGRPKLTRFLSMAAVYPTPGEAQVAQDRLRGDQAAHASVVHR